jgi:hypothetical protein
MAVFSFPYVTGLDEMNTSVCSSYGASIAPVPASYLALASSFNATYTGTFPTAIWRNNSASDANSNTRNKLKGSSKASRRKITLGWQTLTQRNTGTGREG